MGEDRQWWTVKQIALLLKGKEVTVRRWVQSGALKGQLIGGTKLGYRVARADLDAFLQLRYGKGVDQWRASQS